MELGVGVSLAAATSGLAAVPGVAIGAHGLDGMVAGGRQAICGYNTDSGTSTVLQMAGMSRSTATMFDAGLGIAGGARGVWLRSHKIATEIAPAAQKIGMPLEKAIKEWEVGQKALNGVDFKALLALGGTDPLKRAALMAAKEADGVTPVFKSTTTPLEGYLKSLTLVHTGLTPRADRVAGVVATGARGTELAEAAAECNSDK